MPLGKLHIPFHFFTLNSLNQGTLIRQRGPAHGGTPPAQPPRRGRPPRTKEQLIQKKGRLGKHGHTRHATPRHRHPGIAISEPSDKRARPHRETTLHPLAKAIFELTLENRHCIAEATTN